LKHQGNHQLKNWDQTKIKKKKEKSIKKRNNWNLSEIKIERGNQIQITSTSQISAFTNLERIKEKRIRVHAKGEKKFENNIIVGTNEWEEEDERIGKVSVK